MKMIQQGFTLIELMIVVAIIGILAAVAIPSYNDYTARAQVSEAMSLTSGTKTGLAEWYSDRGTFPVTVASVTGSTSGKYVAALAFPTATGTDMVVTATLKGAGSVNSAIAGLVFAISTTSGAQRWFCGTQGPYGASTTLLAKHLPAACK